MKDYLVVLNKDEYTVSYVTPDTGDTEAKVEVDVNPHEVAVTGDGSLSYITNSGGNTVSVLDNRKFEEVARLSHPEFVFPHGIGLSKDETELFVVATRSNRLFIIDTESLETTDVIPTHQKLTHMVYMNPDRSLMFIPNIGSDNITVFDVQSKTVLTHLPVGGGPEGAAVHPDGDLLYVANQKDDNVQIIDLESYETVKVIRVGTCPIRLMFSPDGKYAFVPNRESNDLSMIECAGQREIKRIPTGVWPGGTVFDPEGQRAFVANNKTNDISVVDVDSLEEVGRFKAGIHPDGMAYARVQ